MSKLLVTAALAAAIAACGSTETTTGSPGRTQVTSAATTGPRAMLGVYHSDGASAVFHECGSGQVVRVAREGDEFVFLDKTYGRMNKKPGEDVVTNVVGHMERRGSNTVLVIDRVDRLATGKGVACSVQP